MPGGLRDCRVKGFVGLVEAVAVSGLLHAALALDELVDLRHLFRGCGVRGELRRQLLECAAHQNRFR